MRRDLIRMHTKKLSWLLFRQLWPSETISGHFSSVFSQRPFSFRFRLIVFKFNHRTDLSAFVLLQGKQMTFSSHNICTPFTFLPPKAIVPSSEQPNNSPWSTLNTLMNHHRHEKLYCLLQLIFSSANCCMKIVQILLQRSLDRTQEVMFARRQGSRVALPFHIEHDMYNSMSPCNDHHSYSPVPGTVHRSWGFSCDLNFRIMLWNVRIIRNGQITFDPAWGQVYLCRLSFGTQPGMPICKKVSDTDDVQTTSTCSPDILIFGLAFFANCCVLWRSIWSQFLFILLESLRARQQRSDVPFSVDVDCWTINQSTVMKCGSLRAFNRNSDLPAEQD